MNLSEKIYNGIKSGKFAKKSFTAIYRATGLPPHKKREVRRALDGLVKDGLIVCAGDCYGTPAQLGAFEGVVRANAKGFAFITPSDGGEDCYASPSALGEALDKDVVLAVRVPHSDRAQVIKILRRGVKTVTGRFEKDGRAGYVLTDDDKFGSDVYIPLPLCGGAKSGDKVVAEITSYPKGKLVGGKIVEILGEDGDFEAEELALIRSYGLQLNFPEGVEMRAEEVAKAPIRCDGRRDLTSLLTVTIDGEDTRDIDDAVSLERAGENFVLGVHIADVSNYVEVDGILDKEAYSRGTSVYFPDRVLPMLPKALSNGACSLNEGEKRLAMSCFMTFDGAGKMISYDLCESVIVSKKRLTYNLVTKILEGDDAGVNGQICSMLRDMAQLTLILEGARSNSGSVSLDVKEAHIYVDERGEIVIPSAERQLSQRLIEQFMISANETVARYAQSAKAPFLYRVHLRPAPEKASNFFAFLKDLGVSVKADAESVAPKDFKKILDAVENKPFAAVVNKVMLRSMQKAKYCEKNEGHFGLASQCYCHFTSPIRRYPDLFVHRVLKLLLKGEGGKADKLFRSSAPIAAADCSQRERNADSAERDVDDLYKVVYMSERIGETYPAVISGVTAHAVYAELENGIEGVIFTEHLPKDYYEFYEERLLLKGRKHSFRIGDGIFVTVAACDFAARKVHFSVAAKESAK